ncbi:hypothetical protein IC617_12080 [Neiella sp. HB171785]|uniref:Uncharacterized protein n=1 Tax=Neiella litorisoli TaxID=2771431 RepID=A0A8J6QHZ2_9GAMM|nr:hypothetical protein [Neiella litorisoli]MBD1390170.1 hypothetical protein [Neiella litorisoli]
MLMIDEAELHRWAFDRELASDEQIRVVRYEPRQHHDNGWSLVSVDGVKPSIDEQWQFLQSFEPAQSERRSLVENRLTRLIQPATLQLLQQTESTAHYRFKPTLKSFTVDSQHHLEGELWFDVRHQHIYRVIIKSTAPLESKAGVTFPYFNLELSFAREQGFILPEQVKMRFGGQVNGLNVFAQNTVQHYKNYRLIFPPPSYAERQESAK